MPAESNDLRHAERRVEEAQRLVTAERARVARLRASGQDASDAEEMLAAFETNLKLFEENRQLLVDEHKARMAQTLATREEALGRLKAPPRIRDLRESLREGLARLRPNPKRPVPTSNASAAQPLSASEVSVNKAAEVADQAPRG